MESNNMKHSSDKIMYDLDIGKAIEFISKSKAKRVLLQLPDGLKPYANIIAQKIEDKSDAEVIIWAGSCFGACDVPIVPKENKIDAIIQWGHAEWI